MVPPLAAAVGWQWTFVVTGALGFLWFVAWTAFYRAPQHHPWLTDEDRPLLPPQVRPVLYGFFVAPKTVLKVCDPAPNSGVFVLPTVIAPAARILVTISASRVGTLSR